MRRADGRFRQMAVHRLLVLLLLPAVAWASLKPVQSGTQAASASSSSPQSKIAAAFDENVAIAAQAEAATTAGQPAEWLITFKASEQQVQRQAEVISQAAAMEVPSAQAESIARQQVYGTIKARVLGAAAAPSSASVTEEAGVAGAQQQQAGAVQVLQDYSHMPITFASISSAAELARLRAHPDVVSVVANGMVRPMLMAGLELIGQPQVEQQGFTGGGTVVVVDTGIDYIRPAFGPCTAPGVPAATCKVVYAKDLAPEDNTLDNNRFHGTNVAGIIAATAPGVKLISLDVFYIDSNGKEGATFASIIDAANWAVANKQAYNITAINLSLGGLSTTDSCDTQPLAAALNTAFDAGIMSAAASGNEASKSKVLVPACATKVVAVGAVYSEPNSVYGSWGACSDPSNPPVDRVACFSNSAPMLDILAPGVGIAAADVTLSGTSQATPFVAAALAIVRSRFPQYTLPEVVSALTRTGVMVKDPVNGLDRPRLNLQAAVSGAPATPCSVSVSPQSLRAPNTGGTLTFQVTPTTADCSWSVAIPQVSWLQAAGPTAGKGPGTITLRVNGVTTAARSTGLAVTATSEQAANVLVTQAAADAQSMATDQRAPVMGRVSGSITGSSMKLTWPAAKDNQSGVSSYRVVYRTGDKQPYPRCMTGTAVNQQPTAVGSNMQVAVAGLSAGTSYTFRVCAIDAAGNVAAGRAWRSSSTSG